MTGYIADLTRKRAAGILGGVLTSGVLASSMLYSAPPANATCVSFFGIGSGAGCKSGFGSIAIAIGPGATAWAEGFFSSALAVGTNSTVYTDPSGVLQFATALGESAEAEAYGVLALAVATGTDGAARAENGFANIALNLATQPSFTLAKGSLNIAVNLFGRQTPGGDNITSALGTGNLAINLLGNNDVAAGKYSPDVPAVGSVAFSFFGNGNTVTAVPGPFAVAGSIGQNGATVSKSGPGFNINGLKVGGAAAVNSRTAAVSSASSATPRPAASTGASKRSTAKSAAAANRRAAR